MEPFIIEGLSIICLGPFIWGLSNAWRKYRLRRCKSTLDDVIIQLLLLGFSSLPYLAVVTYILDNGGHL